MYANILVPIDISYDTMIWQQPALENAWQLAQIGGGRIHAMTVVPDKMLQGFFPDLSIVRRTRETKRELKDILTAVVPKEASMTIGVEYGAICSEILRVARELPADVIVMSSHGPMARDYLLGSNAAYITLHAPCSVFIVRKPSNAEKPQTFMQEVVEEQAT